MNEEEEEETISQHTVLNTKDEGQHTSSIHKEKPTRWACKITIAQNRQSFK